MCAYPADKPTCIDSWSRVFQQNLTTHDIFSDFFHPIYNRKSVDFHWKTLHRTIFTESKLKSMKKSNGICKICNSYDETINHLLF